MTIAQSQSSVETSSGPRPRSIAPPPVAEAQGIYLTAVEAKVVAAVGDDLTEQTPLAVMRHSPAPPSVRDESGGAGAYLIPPAVLAPRFTGEPLRADLTWPPRPRGTGEAWPPEARIDAGEHDGRLPIGYAWPLLAGDGAWRWRFEGRESSVRPADAIVFTAAALAGLRRQRASVAAARPAPVSTPVGLVVPGHLSPAAQQHLTDAAAKLGLNLHLLARPLAASLEWCRRFADNLEDDRAVRTGPIGSVLTLHLGLDEWEVGLVDIVPHHHGGRTTYLPRRRRDGAAVLRSYGIELMHRLAVRSLELSYQQATPSRVWELVWCTPWMKTVLAQLNGKDVGGYPKIISLARHARRSEFLIQQCRQATQRIFRTDEQVPALLRSVLGQSPQFTDIRDWFAAQSKRAAEQTLLGAVVTGPMTLIPHERTSLAQHYLDKLWPRAKDVLIEGEGLPRHAMAEAAAMFAAQCDGASSTDAAPDACGRAAPGSSDTRHSTPDTRHGRVPLFLDHTAAYRIAARVDGRAGWVPLFEFDTDSLPAGQTRRRTEPLSGLPIPAGRRHFTLAVHADDWPTVRIASARLPTTLYRPEPVRLLISQRPGHGYPVIELQPQRQGLFGRHRVFVDFRDLRDTGKTPDAFLATLDRPQQ